MKTSHTSRLFGFLLQANVAVVFMIFACTPVCAEIPRDVRDVFESMLDNVEPDLQKQFQQALDRGTTTVEFTPEQFRRFRDNPFNPFEGLDEIDASDGAGNIALKFELPSLRNRPKRRFEKQNRSLVKQLHGQVSSASASTVRVFDGSRHVAMGTIVGTDGLILTKASEVKGRKEITCEIGGGQKLPAETVRVNDKNDLVLLKIDATGLPVINWSDRQPLIGDFLLTPDEDQHVMAVGNYSFVARSTSSGEQAFLGVKPRTVEMGVEVSEIETDNASWKAGLRDGDIITRLAGNPIRQVSDLVFQIRQQRPGDQVAIEYLRNGQARSTRAILEGNQINGERAARYKMMNRLGAVPSRRSTGFPVVFQHDTPLFPEQCGGPITDLDGNVVGLNIARNGRAATYAIPASHVRTVLSDLMREDVASRN